MAQFLTFILDPVSGGAGQLEPKYKAEIQLTAEELIEIADKLEGGKRQPGNSMTVFDEDGNIIPEEEWREWEENGEWE